MTTRILIVDDDFISRTVLMRRMEQFGQCDVASDGEEAMAAFGYALKQAHAYDIVCLDIEMPNMDGHEALQAMREMEDRSLPEKGTRRAKVLMTTGHKDVKSVSAAWNNLCDGYLVKPIRQEQLDAQLQEWGFTGTQG